LLSCFTYSPHIDDAKELDGFIMKKMEGLETMVNIDGLKEDYSFDENV